MKLVKVDEVKAKMLEVMKSLQKDYPDRNVTMVTCESKDKKCVQFIFEIKSVLKELRKTGCRIKTAAYIFEDKKHVSAFIVNGVNMKLVFHNHSVNAPEISIHYLNDTLLHGIKWLEEKEKEVDDNKEKHREIREKAANSYKKPRKPSGRNPVPRDKNSFRGKSFNGGQKDTPNGSKRHYNENGGRNIQKPLDRNRRPCSNKNKMGRKG